MAKISAPRPPVIPPSIVICDRIARVTGGWIISVPNTMTVGGGQIVCSTWAEVIAMLTKLAGNPKP